MHAIKLPNTLAVLQVEQYISQ